MINLQKHQTNNEHFQKSIDANILFELNRIREDIENIKENQHIQEEKIKQLIFGREDDVNCMKNISKDVLELKENKKNEANNYEKFLEKSDFKVHKDEVFEVINSNRQQLSDIENHKKVQEMFNQDVIKEFHSVHRELKSIADNDFEDQRKNLMLIEKEIVGTWKPSSLQNYTHFAKPGEPISRSQWLTGHLKYKLNLD